MYSVGGYGRMIADTLRMDGYVQALRQAVRPGCVVLDLGTGTGIMALLACRLGAGRVYALEFYDIIQVAREVAAVNGLGDRIEFLQGLSTEVTLPERADVIVSDLRDVLPFYQRHLPVIADARKRFLAPGGTLIPLSDTLWAAVVEAPQVYSSRVTCGQVNGFHFNLKPAERLASNTSWKVRVTPEQLLSEPLCWGTLDYCRVESWDVSAELRWTIVRAGTGHGFVAWFDMQLAEGVQLSNSPAAPELIHGNAFFPWSEPVSLEKGDTVAVSLRANLIGEGYNWCWDTRVLSGSQPGRDKASFAQSTFLGVPISPEQLRKQSASYLPQRNEEGEIDLFVLQCLDGGTSLDEIARRATERFPHRFAAPQEALKRVAELSLRYSR